MKTYKMTERKIIEPKNIEDKTLCDICKEEIYEKGYEVSDATVEVEFGTNYGYEGGEKTKLMIDVCEKCFKEKLIPLIENEYSIKFQKSQYDW